MTTELKEIINKESEKYEKSENPNERIGILYNLIWVKQNYADSSTIMGLYRDIKFLINDYIQLVKVNDYGYDLISESKLISVISFLSIHEQISILKYLLSTLSREFPEIEKDWVQNALNEVKLKILLNPFRLIKLPHAFLLFSSLSFVKLLIALCVFVGMVSLILLPAPFEWMEIFKIKYSNYSSSVVLNHILNVVSLFGAIKGGCEVTAINAIGLLMQVFGKVCFVIIMVNFVYKKISDKLMVV